LWHLQIYYCMHVCCCYSINCIVIVLPVWCRPTCGFCVAVHDSLLLEVELCSVLHLSWTALISKQTDVAYDPYAFGRALLYVWRRHYAVLGLFLSIFSCSVATTRLPGNRLWNYLLCVEWGVELCSLTGKSHWDVVVLLREHALYCRYCGRWMQVRYCFDCLLYATRYYKDCLLCATLHPDSLDARIFALRIADSSTFHALHCRRAVFKPSRMLVHLCGTLCPFISRTAIWLLQLSCAILSLISFLSTDFVLSAFGVWSHKRAI